MKIGIDARFLTHPQRGGFKTYTCSLISALVAHAHQRAGDEYVLYTDRSAILEQHLPAGFSVIAVPGSFPLREQVALPLRMLEDGVEVAHFLCNTGPLLYPRPMVVTIHDVIPLRGRRGCCLSPRHRLLRYYWRFVVPRCAHRARLVITGSRSAARDLAATLNLSERRVRVVRHGIDPVFRDGATGVRPDAIAPGEQFLVAFAGADGRKNETRAIAAYRAVSSDFPGLKLVIVCSNAGTRTRVAHAAGVGVLPVGPVTLDQLCWLYREARALLFPSLDEGFGLPPLEAMASGTPVVASRTGALPEVLGDAAIFIDPEDERSVAQGIRDLLGGEGLSDLLRAKGLERAERFTPERMAEETVRVYSEVMDAEKAVG